MTNQELFDSCLTHMRFQRELSVKDYRCRYRLGELSCAIGCLIPDSKYSLDIEDITVTNYLVRDAAGIERNQTSLANDIQYYLHDSMLEKGFDTNTLEINARKVANNWNLEYVTM